MSGHPQAAGERILEPIAQALQEFTLAGTRMLQALAGALPASQALAPLPSVEMNLAHLRTQNSARTEPQEPTEAAFEAREAAIADMLEELCDPIFAGEPLRVMTAMFFFDKQGYCSATQARIATRAKLPKITIQRILEVFQARGIMRRYSRPGSSDVCVFADGTRDALRQKKLLKIRPHKRRKSRLEKTFANPLALQEVVLGKDRTVQGIPAQEVIQGQGGFGPNLGSKIPAESKTLVASQHRVQDATHPETPSSSPVVFQNHEHTTPPASVREERTQEPGTSRAARVGVGVLEKANDEATEPTASLPSRSLPRPLLNDADNQRSYERENVSNSKPETSDSHRLGDGLKREERLSPSSVSPHCERGTMGTREKEMPVVASVTTRAESAETTLESLLIAEGVSPSQARLLTRTYSANRISRNLALAGEVDARNPGGYLAEAIRRDYAASAIKPGSEAAQAREREKPAPKSIRIGTIPPEAPASTPINGQETASTPALPTETADDASALLDALTEPEKAALRERAIADLDRRNAWMGPAWKHEGAAFEAMVRGRMLKLVRGEDAGEKPQPTAFASSATSASSAKSAVLSIRSDHDRREGRLQRIDLSRLSLTPPST